MKPLQLAVRSSSGKSKYANGASLKNWYVQAVPKQGAKSPVILVGTPGTSIYTTLDSSPVIEGYVMNGKLYVVTATKLYRIDSLASATELGDIDIGVGAVLATNGIYLCITGASGNGYHYSIDGGLVKFSGSSWLSYRSVRFLDGYFVFSSSSGSDVYGISSLNGVDLDITEISYAESDPDPVMAHQTLNGELWFFGESVSEVHYNSADVDFPFERRQGVVIERGIAAPYSLIKDNTLYWLGDDRIFYMANGYQYIRVSDHEFEESIAVGNVSDARAYIYTEEGHKFIVVTFPSLNLTWAYDLTTRLWARRGHSKFGGRHHGNCFFRAYNKNLVGDFQNGNIYEMSLESTDDNGDNIVRDVVCPSLHADRERVSLHKFEVRMKTGTTTDDEAPEAMLRWSDDDRGTWSNWHRKSFGKKGERLTRVRWTRLGQFRERNMWVRISEPVKNLVISGIFGDFS